MCSMSLVLGHRSRLVLYARDFPSRKLVEVFSHVSVKHSSFQVHLVGGSFRRRGFYFSWVLESVLLFFAGSNAGLTRDLILDEAPTTFSAGNLVEDFERDLPPQSLCGYHEGLSYSFSSVIVFPFLSVCFVHVFPPWGCGHDLPISQRPLQPIGDCVCFVSGKASSRIRIPQLRPTKCMPSSRIFLPLCPRWGTIPQWSLRCMSQSKGEIHGVFSSSGKATK